LSCVSERMPIIGLIQPDYTPGGAILTIRTDLLKIERLLEGER
jgi:hypothetical protein